MKLALASDHAGFELKSAIVEAWLEVPFEGGRHARRVGEITALENANFKNKRRRTGHVPTE